MAGMDRKFTTGAVRDLDNNKLDYEGFLSPVVLQRYAQYMHKNRFREGTDELRDSDNWQLGIPKDAYVKSLIRHLMDVWLVHDQREDLANEDVETALCAIIFNAQGLLFEILKDRQPESWDGLTVDAGGAGFEDPWAPIQTKIDGDPSEWKPTWAPNHQAARTGDSIFNDGLPLVEDAWDFRTNPEPAPAAVLGPSDLAREARRGRTYDGPAGGPRVEER